MAMGISIYQIAPQPANEALREAAVIRSEALTATGLTELQTMVDRASDLFGTSMAAVSIVFRDWQYLIAAKGMTPGVYRRSTSFCGHAIMTPNDIFVVEDAARDARFAGNPNVLDDPELRFYAGAPLLDNQGLPLGALCVLDPTPRHAVPHTQTQELAAMAREIVRLLSRDAVIAEPPRAAATG
jgi:GAF domain-containing protein